METLKELTHAEYATQIKGYIAEVNEALKEARDNLTSEESRQRLTELWTSLSAGLAEVVALIETDQEEQREAPPEQ
jgi:hypothetical protein